MFKLVLGAALSSSLFLAGCASSPGGKSGERAPEYTRLAAPVAVPKASSRNVVLAMTGPKAIVESKDWGEFQREWRETFADHAKLAGAAYRFVDGEAQPTGMDGTILQVTVNDYRIMGVGMRLMLGIMAGNAYIDAKVRFLNLRDGAAFGEQQYNTSSSASGGVFSRVTPQQVDAIAGSIFVDVKEAK